ICVPVCVHRASDLAEAVERAVAVGDLVEVRFDCLAADEVAEAFEEYARLRQKLTKPLVVTFRPPEEGGRQKITTDERLSFWRKCAALWSTDQPSTSDFADVEFQLLTNDAWQDDIPFNRVISSHHDFAGVPDDLEKLYEHMLAMPSRLRKIAVGANDATDCIP